MRCPFCECNTVIHRGYYPNRPPLSSKHVTVECLECGRDFEFDEK